MIQKFSCVVVFALIYTAAIAGPFYTAHTVAKTGVAGTTEFLPGISINDKGNVAFVAEVGQGDAIFFAERGKESVIISSALVSVNRLIQPAVQINNDDFIVGRDILTVNPVQCWLRIWEGASPDVYTQILYAPSDPFNKVWSYPCISNENHTAFSGSNNMGNTILGSGGNTAKPAYIYRTYVSLQPAISDKGEIVYQYEVYNPAISKIFLSNYTLSVTNQIASTQEGYTELGAAPGISDDGLVIAFVGNRGKGDGIFVAAKLGAEETYRTFCVAGENDDTEPKRPDLSYNIDSGEGIKFESFDMNYRIGVTRVPFGNGLTSGHTYLVSFIAKPSQASPHGQFNEKKGLFVLPLGVEYIPEEPGYIIHRQFPLAVAQEGDTLDGNAVGSDIVYNDPLARYSFDEQGATRNEMRNDHQVAFLLGTDTIVRATHEYHLAVIPHSQKTKIWETILYDHHPEGKNIFERGCGLNSACMALDYIGVQHLNLSSGKVIMNPLTLNQFMNENNAYQNSNVYWDNLASAFKDRYIKYRGEKISSRDDKPKAIQYLKDVLKIGYPVIVAVQELKNKTTGKKTFPTHFILVTGYNEKEDDFTINDPGWSFKRKLSVWNFEFETRGYFCPGPKPQPRRNAALRSKDDETTPTSDYSRLALSLADSAAIMLTSPSGQKIGVDTSTTTPTLISQIPGACIFRDAIQTFMGEDLPPEAPDSGSWYLHIPVPEEGKWQIILTGVEDDPFLLDLRGFAWDNTVQTTSFIRKGNLPAGQSLAIDYTYSAEPTIPPPPNNGIVTY